MDIIEIKAELRNETGKGSAHKLRDQGFTPAIVYGPGMEPTKISISSNRMIEVIETGMAMRSLIKLDIEEDPQFKNKILMFREIQRHHIKRTPIAADLYEVNPNKKVEVSVPLKFVGNAEGILLGGLLQPLVRSLTVMCKPDNMPDNIEADVSGLKLGYTLYLSDLVMPEGVEVALDLKSPIATIVIPRGIAASEEVESVDAEETGESATEKAPEKAEG